MRMKLKDVKNVRRCHYTGKIINGRNVVLADETVLRDYLTKLGFIVLKKRYFNVAKVSFFLFIFFYIATALVSAGFGYNNDNLPIIHPEANITIINISEGDDFFWTLDGTNKPTANWDMDGFGFNNMGAIVFDTIGSPFIDSYGVDILRLNADLIEMETPVLRLKNPFAPDIAVAFNSVSGIGSYVWRGDWDAFLFQDHILMGSGKNITSERYCQTSGLCYNLTEMNESLEFDNVNLAYLNNSQTFIGNNTFEEITYLSEVIHNDVANWTFFNQSTFIFKPTPSGDYGGILWDSHLGDNFDASLLFTGTTSIWKAVTLVAQSQFLTIGDGTQADTGILFDTSVTDDEFNFNGQSYSISYPLLWDSGSAGRRAGLIFDNIGATEQNNFTWDGFGCLLGDCDVKFSSVGNINFINQDLVNFSSNVKINGDLLIDLPLGPFNSTTYYLCIDENGGFFKNETACR